MVKISTENSRFFKFNDISTPRLFMAKKQGETYISVVNSSGSCSELIPSHPFADYQIDGTTYTTLNDTMEAINNVVYAIDSGGGSEYPDPGIKVAEDELEAVNSNNIYEAIETQEGKTYLDPFFSHNVRFKLLDYAQVDPPESGEVNLSLVFGPMSAKVMLRNNAGHRDYLLRETDLGQGAIQPDNDKPVTGGVVEAAIKVQGGKEYVNPYFSSFSREKIIPQSSIPNPPDREVTSGVIYRNDDLDGYPTYVLVDDKGVSHQMLSDTDLSLGVVEPGNKNPVTGEVVDAAIKAAMEAIMAAFPTK